MRPVVATIDTDALRHNLAKAQTCRPEANILAVIKANAYGHGAVACAKALSDADAFAVASIEEAEVLFNHGVTKRIVLLAGFFEESELALIFHRQWIPVIHTEQQIQLLHCWFQKNPEKSCDIFLKIDTGMHRLGVPLEKFAEWHAKILAIPNIKQCTLMTHFACADELENKTIELQLQCFESLTKQLDNPCSLANSALVMSDVSFRDNWIRPGIMLYGASPFKNGNAQIEGLEPVMTLSSAIIACRVVNAGEQVGYGGDWQAKRQSVIATVAMGYGDGYPRHVPTGTPVIIRNQRCPIVGRVSMDFITVDVTDCPHAAVGDEVIFWGKELPTDEIATQSKTIAYELLTGISQRVRYVYK